MNDEHLSKIICDHADLKLWKWTVETAVQAQANDETLWTVNIPGEPFQVTVGEAYLQQALRNLHSLIERNDLKALRHIINQSRGEI